MLRSSISESTRRCCSLRGEERTYKFKADDEGMAGRWVTALRAVQISCTIAYVAARLVVLCCLVQCYCARIRALVVSPSAKCAAIAEWSTRELVTFGRICKFPEEALSWLQANQFDGQKFGRLKDPAHLAVRFGW